MPSKIILKKTIVQTSVSLFTNISMVFSSYKKENQVSDLPVVNGTISLEVHAIHHSWDVSGILLYLKKNATEFPGKDSSVYEYKGQVDGYGKFTFENLFSGNYYVCASGFDSIWGSHVFGYSPMILDNVHLHRKPCTVYTYS